MNTNMNIRTDLKVKQEAEKLFADFGLNMTAAINLFLRQAIREQAIPFKIKRHSTPNAETIKAMEEGDRLLADKKAKAYGSFSELLLDLESEQ
ncbi:MAG: type II toxin-antitoxin system RelB/DinJ family antitoxin [Oscillospiraceae bacterium]|jgi:DNA-damage-inducible protein J|nr:type II toxin-antitoxin system RelB/DinJ family antitoxin [Oscillospiraceae bacterium]